MGRGRRRGGPHWQRPDDATGDRMGSLIDSGIFIAAERGKLDLEALLTELPDDPIVLSVISASELLHGLHRANAQHRAAREANVNAILARFDLVPFDLPVARMYGQMLAEREAEGRPLPAHDLMIAATAIHLGYRVVTRDARSFPTIGGLEVLLR